MSIKQSSLFYSSNIKLIIFYIEQNNMSIERDIQTIQLFLRGQESIFNYTHLQYPNDKQQKLINSYFFVKKIFLLQSDPDRVFQELIYKNIMNLRLIIMGLFYYSLLDPRKHTQYFGYIKLFRNQGMKFYAQLVKDFLDDQFNNIKAQSMELFPYLYQQFSKYRLITEDFIISILKTINFIDISQKNLTYANLLIQVFQQILKQQLNTIYYSSIFKFYTKYLFIKLVRLLTVIQSIDDQGIIEFKQRCARILILLFNNDSLECVQCGSQVLRYLQQLLGYSSELGELFYNYKNIYYQNAKKIQMISKQKILSINIPPQIHGIILFCVQKNLTEMQIYYQLNWILNKYKENTFFYFLLIDIERYLIRCIDKQNRFTILIWIINYCIKNPIFFQLCKQALFFDWFQQQIAYDQLKLKQKSFVGLKILDIFKNNDPMLCQQLLGYILIQNLKIQNVKLKEKIKKIFKLTQKKYVLKSIEDIFNHPSFDSRIKFELSNILKSNQALIEHNLQQDYNPFKQDDLLKQVQKQEQLNWGSQDYIDIKQSVNVNKVQKKQQQDQLTMTIDKQFYEQNRQKLIKLLQQPNKLNYINFIQNLIKLIKQLKIKKQQQQIQRYIIQTCKCTYLCFQSHFQCFYQVNQQESIVYYFIQKIFMHWNTNALQLEIHKKIIKALLQYFKIAYIAFFYCYFFKIPSTKAYCKQILHYLIQPSKHKQVIRLLKIIVQDTQKLQKLSHKTATYSIYM